MRTATLTLLTLLGLVAGAFYGHYVLFDPLNPIERGHWTFIAGDLLLTRPLGLLVVPLAFAVAMTAASAMRSVPRFGLVLAATLVYFAVTTLIAAMVGAAAAMYLNPGDLPAEARQGLVANANANLQTSPDVQTGLQSITAESRDTLSGAWLDVFRRALPQNVVGDLVDGRLLGLVTLAILLGVGAAMVGARSRQVTGFFEGVRMALLRVTRLLTWLAPIAVFLLVANAVGSVGFGAVRGVLENYAAVVAGALAAHAAIVLPILLLLARCNPIGYAWRVGRALFVAAATSSSTAALPVALDAAVGDRNNRGDGDRPRTGCSNAAAGFVLPLGAMINMNGTAVFQAAAIVFLCQVHAISLSTIELVIIIVTTVVAAISTAGVPGAGLATLVIVINAVNTSLAGRGVEPLPVTAIGMLIAVDRLLDTCRTAVNVWGNLVGARIISVIAPDDRDGIATGLTSHRSDEEDADRARRL